MINSYSRKLSSGNLFLLSDRDKCDFLKISCLIFFLLIAFEVENQLMNNAKLGIEI
jgi:hypothetical protein